MKKNNSRSIIYTEEELEFQKKEALKEYNEINKDFKQKKRKKLIIILSILIFIVLIIKIFYGTININNIFGYSRSNARYYYVTVNDEQVKVSYNLRQRIPIIPYLINFDSYYLGNNYIEGNDSNTYYGKNDKYIIDINSFSCFSKENYQIECSKNTQTMKKNNDTKYKKLKITRITNPHEIIYNGNYINDISKYITKKGQYHIEITAKYSFIESKVYFYLEKYK